MLTRTDVLKKIIEVRKSIYRKEMLLDNPPSLEDVKIRKDLDNIIIDIIGDCFSEEDKDHIDNILLKSICDDISIEMAMVAIKEIVMTYYPKQKNNNNSSRAQSDEKAEKQLAAAYYQNGYS